MDDVCVYVYVCVRACGVRAYVYMHVCVYIHGYRGLSTHNSAQSHALALIPQAHEVPAPAPAQPHVLLESSIHPPAYTWHTLIPHPLRLRRCQPPRASRHLRLGCVLRHSYLLPMKPLFHTHARTHPGLTHLLAVCSRPPVCLAGEGAGGQPQGRCRRRPLFLIHRPRRWAPRPHRRRRRGHLWGE
jgi:hypothetical protein